MKVSLDRFPDGKQKALTMSYDDGVIDDVRLVDIFNKYGIKGTFHVNGGLFGKKSWDRLKKDEVAKLYKGHEISAHGYNHRSLTSLSEEGLVYEIMQDRVTLEKMTGTPIRGMSYPFGPFNEKVKKTIKTLGIEYAREVEVTGKFDLPEDFLQWKGTCHHNDRLLERCREFLEWKPFQMTLMYVWGHSYEFSRDNNWEVIEEFCKEIGGRNEIWYATNIQIYDYAKAVRRIKFTANQSIALNQSAMDVWISVNNRPVKIESGKSVKLF